MFVDYTASFKSEVDWRTGGPEAGMESYMSTR